MMTFFLAETTTVKLSFTSNGNRAVGFLDKITCTCCTIGNQEASAVHVEMLQLNLGQKIPGTAEIESTAVPTFGKVGFCL